MMKLWNNKSGWLSKESTKRKKSIFVGILKGSVPFMAGCQPRGYTYWISFMLWFQVIMKFDTASSKGIINIIKDIDQDITE